MIRHIFLVISFLVMGPMFAQDPQTNNPNLIGPLLDSYIKEGFNRNKRRHVENLRTIDFIEVRDISDYLEPRDFDYSEQGESTTYKVYGYWSSAYGEVRYSIAINEIWANNPGVLRRIFFKTMGLSHGLRECHQHCTHIMSARPLIDNKLIIYDLVPENWLNELNNLYTRINNVTSEVNKSLPSK